MNSLILRLRRRLWLPLTILALLSPRPAAADERPGLLFREDWKESGPATPVTQEHVANANLLVTRHGPAEALIKKSHHDQPADDPYYIWSGDANGNWALSLRHKSAWLDLSGQAKIRWRAKQTGFRQLRLILKLADGNWIISDQFDEASNDWRVREINLSDCRWRVLDIKKVVEGRPEPNPNLTRIDEIGWTDLMSGGGTPASSRIDWVEVYGRPVSR